MIGLSNAAHEVVHGHMFFQRRLDLVTGRVLHGLILINHDVHCRYHLVHHGNTGTDRDSEGVFDFDSLNSARHYVARMIRWAVWPNPLIILNWSDGLAASWGSKSHLGRGLSRSKAAAGMMVPLLVLVGLIVWLFVAPLDALLFGVLPELVLFPLVSYAMSLPEHFGLAEREFSDRTRNVVSSPIVQFAVWNFNLHAVHHGNPQLHFSELPSKVDERSATADGYVRFHIDVFRQLTHETRVLPEQLGTRA